MSTGFVTLVGAGPGSADFLTLAAVKALQQAEVIFYDALLSAEIRRLFPRRAKTFYVGKRCGQHALKQEEINQLLVEWGLKGRRVVRLKGGDPFVFGRGAEEVEALRKAAVPYRVIPGVSALNGIAAQWALPLTARGHSNEFRAIQGHHLPDDPSYWHELASYRGTLVLFMSLEKLPLIVERLRAFGAERQRPLAILETDEEGRSHLTRSDLSHVQKLGFERKTRGPGIVYIGQNVALMDTLPSYTQEITHGFALAHLS
jgi:uroporphyrin-III C-methyltransferase